MRQHVLVTVCIGLAASLTGCSGAAKPAPPTLPAVTKEAAALTFAPNSVGAAVKWVAGKMVVQRDGHSWVRVCDPPADALHASCESFLAIDTPANTSPHAAPATISGLQPADLESAYALPVTAGGNETVGIVDAFDDPNAESDLAVYRSTFGLPPCTSQNGCFRKVDQSGGTSYPQPDPNWALEISLDLDMVSAACPQCHILLVEATNSNILDDMAPSVDTAARLGANAISNSYVSFESSTYDPILDTHYNHPGVAVVAASGDDGYDAQRCNCGGGTFYPAASKYVTAVGGTYLVKWTAAVRGWSEGVWSGSGSGCSPYVAKPTWQSDSLCATRTIADVAAAAENIAIYDTYQGPGWEISGGTSSATPIVASVYALAGATAAVKDGSTPYLKYPTGLFDVTNNPNGTCGGIAICQGAPGYDGPSGLGSPDGVTAFSLAAAPPTRTGPASDLAIGSGGLLFTIGTDVQSGGHSVYGFLAPSADAGFSKLPGSAVAIAVDPTGAPWTVDANHVLSQYTWTGSGYTAQTVTAPPLTTIAIGANGSQWALGSDSVSGGHTVYQFTGESWAPIPGAGATAMAVDPKGAAWIVDSNHRLYQYNTSTNAFTQIPNVSATEVAIGANGATFVLGTASVSGGHPVYAYSNGTLTSYSAGAVDLAVDPHGTPWLAASSGHIRRYNSVTKIWDLVGS